MTSAGSRSITRHDRSARRLPIAATCALRLAMLSCVAACTNEQRPPAAEPSVASATAGHGDHDSSGVVDFRISCSTRAQAEFNRAVALLHHMTYPQARAAFTMTATIDSTCAMAQWGIAMTLFQPLWPTRPSPASLRQGWSAVERAMVLHPPTERERLFVATAEAFFRDPASPDYWLRIRRWKDATERLYAAYPSDLDADALYALALLATVPTDSTARAQNDRAAEVLLHVYEQNPDHPGAMHYLVHANDFTGREHESLDITHRYDASAPENPHALHMPTHIYTRLGDWDAVIQGNQRAATAALRYPAGERGQYVWDEFPHAIEYLVYANLQEGADDAAAAEIARLRGTAHLEPSFKTAFHLASTQARYVLERRDWTAARRLLPRTPDSIAWDVFTWPEAISWFAHGVGAAHLDQLGEARADRARLDTLERTTRASGEALFASNIRILRLALEAWIAQRSHHPDSAVHLMQGAVALESATPKHAVTPAPTLPALEQLGDLRMEQGDAAAALTAYQRDLTLYPRRLNGVLGAARAARALGDSAAARQYYQTLLDIASRGTRALPLVEARSFLASSR